MMDYGLTFLTWTGMTTTDDNYHKLKAHPESFAVLQKRKNMDINILWYNQGPSSKDGD